MKILNEFNIKETLGSEKPIVIKFYSMTCPPCRTYAPIFEALAENMKTVDFVECNVREAHIVAQGFNVRSIPTTILVKDSIELSRFTGIRKATDIHKWLNENLPDGWNKETI